MLTPSPLNFRVGPQRGASLPGSRTGSGPAGWGPVGARLGLGLGGAASSLQTLTCWGWSPGRGQSSPACRGGGPARRLRSLHGHEARRGVPGGRRSPGQRQMCLGRSARSSVAPVGGGTGRLAPRLPGGAPVCVSWPLGRTRGTHGCHGEGAPPRPSQAQPWPLLTAAPLRSPRKSSGLGAGSAGPVLRPCTPWDPNPTLGGNAAAAAAPPSAAGPAAACWKDPAPRDVGEWGAAGVLWDSGRPGSPAGGSHHPTQGTGARAWSRRALCF